MPSIPITTYVAGDPLIAGDLNNDYTNTAISTTDLDGLNTRTEWVSRRHVDTANVLTFNKNFNLIEDSLNTQTINSTVYTQVFLGSAFRVTFGTPVTLAPGQVLRAHFDVNVDNSILPAPPDFQLPFPGNSDCYQFAFFVQDDLLNVYRLGCRSTYSVYDLTDHVSAGANPFNAQITERKRTRQRVNHTLCYINTTGADLTLNWIEVRARLVDLAWVTAIVINEGTFTVFTGRF